MIPVHALADVAAAKQAAVANAAARFRTFFKFMKFLPGTNFIVVAGLALLALPPH
jgi:hypothetical protein